MKAHPKSRRALVLVVGITGVAVITGGCGARPSPLAGSANNPGVEAVVATISQWGQCLVDGGESLAHTLSSVKGTGSPDGIVLSFASGDRFLVRDPRSASASASADNSSAQATIAAGLAKDPACHTTKAFPETTVSHIVHTYMHVEG